MPCLFFYQLLILKSNIRKKVIIFRGITHILINLSLYVALIKARDMLNIDIRFNLIIAIIIAIYSILADVDHGGSMLGRRTMGISSLIQATVGHRTMFHSFLAAIILSAPMFLIFGNKIFFIAAALSYSAHICIDLLNIYPMPVFFPSKKKYSFKIVKVGSAEESLISLMCIAFLLL